MWEKKKEKPKEQKSVQWEGLGTPVKPTKSLRLALTGFLATGQ
jgi:hypothetical protein